MSDELAKAKAADFDSIPIADLANIDDPKGFMTLLKILSARQKRWTSFMSAITAFRWS